MNLVESFRIALKALGSNKVRSALTMLGVIIGVAAVILLVSIGTGVQSEVTGSIEGLGSNLLFVFPYNMQAGGGGGGGGFQITKPFTNADADLLARRLGSGAIVVPVVQAPAQLRVGNRTLRSSIAAGSDQGAQVFSGTLAAGRTYTRSEYVSAARVVDIGSTVKNQLFPSQDPLGESISINGQTFTVIGYYEARGGGLGGDQDNQIYMPSTTAQQLLGSSDLSEIIVKAVNAKDIPLIKSQIELALRPVFGQDFTVFTQQQTLGILSRLLGTLTAMLAGLAGISLLVGGIGIMNIMLVSVSERTREIGIRKAVGARTYDILSQFVIEAVVLSVLGGAVGIIIGAGGAALLHRWIPASVTPWAVVLAFFFSAAVGVFFGVYPAYRASRLDPIEALRYE
jgi:putative ABC transport system permease protein